MQLGPIEPAQFLAVFSQQHNKTSYAHSSIDSEHSSFFTLNLAYFCRKCILLSMGRNMSSGSSFLCCSTIARMRS